MEQEFGKCDMCGKESTLSRKYYYYYGGSKRKRQD